MHGKTRTCMECTSHVQQSQKLAGIAPTLFMDRISLLVASEDLRAFIARPRETLFSSLKELVENTLRNSECYFQHSPNPSPTQPQPPTTAPFTRPCSTRYASRGPGPAPLDKTKARRRQAADGRLMRWSPTATRRRWWTLFWGYDGAAGTAHLGGCGEHRRRQGSIMAQGFDSLVAVELRNWVMRQFDAPLHSTEILANQTVHILAEKIATWSKKVVSQK